VDQQLINITLGTAGHIDHGKTALVKNLTGCDTDTLKEEKERGMSIELGHAPCTVAGLAVGIVDVPGHEHFIKTMVAGATGMDAVLLVVAADDGIMPQTREHLDILTLLGIERGLVALTKIDRAGPDRTAQVTADLARLLHGTFLDGAPVCPLSNVTGEGFDGFLQALQALVRSIRPKRLDGVFRLPVEKVFSVKGYGTVVTGIPVAGAAAVGDDVVLLPQGLAGRINALQVYGSAAEKALAGQCAAVNVRHWDAKAVARGNVLTVPGFFAPAQWYVAHLRLLAQEAFTLKNAAQVKFHAGTSEASGTAYLMQGSPARAGDEVLIQVRLDEPLVAGPGDRFILRTASPPRTVGGGWIVEAEDRRVNRNRPGVVDDLRARAAAVRDDRTFVDYCLRRADALALPAADLARRAKTPPARLQTLLQQLADAGRVATLAPGLYAHTERVAEARARVQDALAAYHRGAPASPGMEPDALAEAAGLSRPECEAVTALLRADARVVERAGRLARADHRPALADEDREALERVEALFLDRPFSPPAPDEVAAEAGVPRARAEKALRLLVEEQRLVSVPPGLLFHREAVDRARDLLVDFIRREGCLESVKFKYLLETTRKYAIPLLDHFDRAGVTRAVGHTRYLKAQWRQG